MEEHFLLLQSAEICSRTHPASYTMRMEGEGGSFPPELSDWGIKLTTRLHPVQRLTTREAIPPLLHMMNDFIACRGDFTSLDFKYVML
jgi:hypothetical protein